MYLDASDLNDIQDDRAVDEKRFSQRGIVDLAADSGKSVDYIPPSRIEEMQRISSNRKVQLQAIKDQTVVVETSNVGFNFIPSNLPESAQYTFTAVDIFSGFRFFPATYEDNAIDMEWEKKRRMRAVLDAMAVTKEGLISSVLETNKTQVMDHLLSVSQGDGTFTFSSDILTVSKAAQKETMFYNLEALMAANELPGDYRIATNRAGLAVQKSEAMKYAAGNEKNLKVLGFYGADRMYESGTIQGGSDVFNGWLVRDGDLGLVENFPHDFRAGTSFAGKTWSISDTENPYTRSRLNVYVNTEAVEAGSLVTSSNTLMTHGQEMALWDRFFIVRRYNSDLSTRANAIVKIKGTTT
jgi:hypothetical protein